MNKDDSAKSNVLNLVSVAARWGIGALFIYMGLSKAMHPVEFLKLVRQYDIVTSPVLLNLIAATLPWFEVFCGFLLVTGIVVRGAALISVAMLLPFTIIVFRRALEIAQAGSLPFCAVKFDCGCGAGEVLICRKLVENTVLILVSLWLVKGNGRLFSAWFGLDQRAKLPRAVEAVPPVEAR